MAFCAPLGLKTLLRLCGRSMFTIELSPGVYVGEVPGVAIGSTFVDRRVLHDRGVHRGLMQGIATAGSSIVLAGGYVDDEDFGDTIIYTGEGGRDPNTGTQIADQELSRGNLALVRNYEDGLPVRVVRGHNHPSPFAPTSGYRYDGLFRIDAFWRDRGKDGFNIFRFRLERLQNGGVEKRSEEPSPGNEGAPTRRESVVSRVIRNTRVGREIKMLYDHRCQVCETQIMTPAGPYAECCHIRPLGTPHDGPDSPENVLCLCPNCHVAFDSFGFTISDDLTTSHRPARHLTISPDHRLNIAHLQYHRSSAPR
jgi:putative restriction endonuclease